MKYNRVCENIAFIIICETLQKKEIGKKREKPYILNE